MEQDLTSTLLRQERRGKAASHSEAAPRTVQLSSFNEKITLQQCWKSVFETGIRQALQGQFYKVWLTEQLLNPSVIIVKVVKYLIEAGSCGVCEFHVFRW